MSERKQIKIRKRSNESNSDCAVRLILSADEPLTIAMAVGRVNQRYWKPNESQMRGALDYGVKRGLIKSWKDEHYKKIVYAPCGHLDSIGKKKVNHNINHKRVSLLKTQLTATPADIDKKKVLLKTPHKKNAISDFNKRTGFSERPKIAGLVSVSMTAIDFTETLQRLDSKLYDKVMKAIGDSIGEGGEWTTEGFHYVKYEVKI